jgi:pantoate--beta-alanine ligase
MQIVRTRSQLSALLAKLKGPVFFVPTMGSLHEGHLSLIRAAASDARKDRQHGTVIMSIFVNPTQFSDQKDFATYPRDEISDIALAKRAGCDVLFIPENNEMYLETFAGTTISIPLVSKLWEGEFRPGHFEGVATVVAKLFHLILPDFAYFGEKDWQQCRVIQTMVDDLDFPVYLRFCETVREADGLAMSSRNRLIRPEMRARASELYKTLRWAAEAFEKKVDPREIEKQAIQRIQSAGFSKVDYFAIVDQETLQLADKSTNKMRILTAAHLAGVRLIDNVPVKRYHI